MIQLIHDQLIFSFPEVHPDARLLVQFHRTLRIPDGGRELPRLPSLGRFPLYSIEDYSRRVPSYWLDHGGAILPMYQSEAMWLSFQPAYSLANDAFYPFAVRVAVGQIDAVTGGRFTRALHQWPQDYLVITDQSWLGGFQTGRGGVRQFVAMPLGFGHLPESRKAGPNRFGRVTLKVFPMRRVAFDGRYPLDPRRRELEALPIGLASKLAAPSEQGSGSDALVRQGIEEGLFPLEDWQVVGASQYCLHLANSLHWCAITGSPPPASAPSLRSARRHVVAAGRPLLGSEQPLEVATAEGD